ncbi:MAG TPA: hypothetical protein VLJ68_13910, partial [Chitinophagaceae bacterium]|nr:hypothetical protein [Chitinophagaceae bacterium]
MSTIETRLLALEKSNRRYKKIVSSLVLVAGLISVMAFTKKNVIPDLLQARNFEVVNTQGSVVARMTTLDGSGRISTFNTSGGKMMDMIPNDAGGGALIVYDGKGNMNARITYTEGGGGSIGVYNGSGKQVIRFGNTTGGA